ncbi:thiamine-phosphate kinase [Paenibacillus sp. 1011MAR3C5]|uniref:thiamine-phosphate kinase n=1 Tax=Paenibacillus sp. 1011MAR3C5 TaxID=1675787 RepID=UPI000E6BC942|nr:thiamine-phosphate kinase [Paenibacillus sp. 1011MAR3C5]RJE87660.1 thiamine-phosphate kinase [Paenibacillus sp. 1011MAR3C5]
MQFALEGDWTFVDEFARIRYWTSERQSVDWQLARGVALGIGDDAAVLDFGIAQDGIIGERRQLLVSDTMVEQIHFAGHTMKDEHIGYKALAANVSDIAAMGGVPLHAVVSVCVPPSCGPERVKRIYDGLYACAEQYGVAIVGGDTTSSPAHLVISIALTGAVEAGKEMVRSGAQPGDAVFVTGPVGMSAAGLHMLQAAVSDKPYSALVGDPSYRALLVAHQQPSPSVLAGRLLLRSGICHSLNDVSDGLASEAWEIAEASSLRVVLDERSLPKSGSMSAYASQAGANPLDWMLYGGEDYVLIGTIDTHGAAAVKSEFQRHGLPFYVIGMTEEGSPGVELIPLPRRWDGSGSKAAEETLPRMTLPKRGFNHFGT